jgi:hypothetical protein
MLQQPLIDKLLALRLPAMADALKTQEQDQATKELSFLERLGMLVDQQWTWRESGAGPPFERSQIARQCLRGRYRLPCSAWLR